MPAVFLSPIGDGWQFRDDNGAPLAGGFINTYAAGTTTPLATYTTSAGNVPNSNPIGLNGAGRIATQVWLQAATAYKFQVVSSVSSAVGIAQDNLYGINDPTTINGIGYTGATISGALIMNQAPINEAQGANIAVASAINLTTATGNYLSLTGSGTVTAIQLSQGAYRELVVNTVSGAFVNSNTLALLGGASFTPAVGDILGFRGEAAPVVRQVLYSRANGLPVTVTPINVKLINSTFDMTTASGTTKTITGVPFRAALVRMATGFVSVSNAASIGESDGIVEWTNAALNTTPGQALNSPVIGIAFENASDNQVFTLLSGGSINSDGCTIKNPKGGPPTGTINMAFTFMR